MIRGTSVTVRRRTMTSRDEMGEPVFSVTSETVDNVLITPSSTDEIDETNRAFGVTCELTLHFPKSYEASLEGCEVVLFPPYGDAEHAATSTTTTTGPGAEHPYRVIGDPQPYMAANTPTPWNRAARVARADG